MRHVRHAARGHSCTKLDSANDLAARCAHCHGENGRGGPADPLTGEATSGGAYWPYATTLFDYTRRAMPLERPGSLTDDEVYALTAYLLHLNGLWSEDRALDRTSLPRIVMPARDRFVPDDRRGGAEIR